MLENENVPEDCYHRNRFTKCLSHQLEPYNWLFCFPGRHEARRGAATKGRRSTTSIRGIKNGRAWNAAISRPSTDRLTDHLHTRRWQWNLYLGCRAVKQWSAVCVYRACSDWGQQMSQASEPMSQSLLHHLYLHPCICTRPLITQRATKITPRL